MAARVPSDDPLEAARRFYILAWQGRGGPCARWSTGWRFQRKIVRHNSAIEQWNDLSSLNETVLRLKKVHIECDDALKVISYFDTPSTLFYCDPPYLATTRSKWSNAGYDHEMSEGQHRELAALLQGIKGMAIVSGYPSPVYDELYDGWQCVTKQSRIDSGKSKTECLWLSPAVMRNRLQSSFLVGGNAVHNVGIAS